MNTSNHQEIWQIDVGGQIYEASFEEMTQWIFEGALLPQDLVKRGNLRWIEARKVPLLAKFFEAKEQGHPPPAVAPVQPVEPATSEDAATPPVPSFLADSLGAKAGEEPAVDYRFQQDSFDSADPAQNSGHAHDAPAGKFDPPPAAEPSAVCSVHPDLPTKYVCDTCHSAFCKSCPKSYGGTVKICPFCGAMCHATAEVQQKKEHARYYQTAVSEGFGLKDFGEALAYPFKFKTSLFVGAIMFMFFTLGQNAASVGGFYLAAAALICWMLANMLTFGVLANTIDNFTQGRLGLNFMPNFDDFSLWDDVVHPLFLSVAAYLVSFGLLFVLVGGVIWYTLNSIRAEIKTMGQAHQMQLLSDEDSPVRKKTAFEQEKEKFEEHLADESAFPNTQVRSAEEEEEEFRRINEMINQHRREQLESAIGQSPETRDREFQMLTSKFYESAGPVVILALVFLLWGMFYFPAACAVAGYTRSFWATLNPSIGLETIKILGVDYLKIWLMALALAFMAFLVGLLLAMVLAPFDLPKFGNLPAKAVGALFGFYFSVVFSCILGFALYKNADKLSLYKG